MTKRLLYIIVLTAILAVLGSFVYVQNAAGQTVTVTAGTGVVRIQNEFKSELGSRSSESNSGRLTYLAAEYHIKHRWLAEAHVDFGNLSDMGIPDYRASMGEVGALVSYEVAEGAWLQFGFERHYHRSEMSTVLPIFTSSASPELTGLTKTTYLQKETHEGPLVGLQGRGERSRVGYRLGGQLYPLLWQFNEQVTSYSHDPEAGKHPVTIGGHAWGWRMDGALSYRLVKGLSVEGAIDTVAIYGPNKNEEHFTNQIKTTIRAVYSF